MRRYSAGASNAAEHRNDDRGCYTKCSKAKALSTKGESFASPDSMRRTGYLAATAVRQVISAQRISPHLPLVTMCKSMKVYIEGKLRTRKWMDKNNQERYTTEIHAFEMQMLDSKESGTSVSELPGQQSNIAMQAPPQGDTKTTTEPVAEGEFDDDIPF